MIEVAVAIKRLVGVGLLVGSAGYFTYDHLSLSASYAVVAAPASYVDAPCDGVLTESVENFAVLRGGTSLGSVKPTPGDDPELRAVAAELQTNRADVASLQKLVALGEEMEQKVNRRRGALSQRRVAHLEQLFHQASSEVSTRRAMVDGAELAEKRATSLCEQGLMTVQECDALKTKAEIERKQVAFAEGQAQIARFLVDSRNVDADVGESIGSEVTYARAQSDDLRLRLAALQQQLETRSAKVKADELRLNPPALDVSVGGTTRVWRAMYKNGSRVLRGKALYQVVNCDELFVFAAVDEERYEKLRLGMKAVVKVSGREYEGKVAQLLGPYGSFAQDPSFQPQPPVIVSGRDSAKAAVAVAVPALRASQGQACEVGTRVELRFVP